MNFIDLLNETMQRIIKGNGKETGEELIRFLKKEGWPSNLNKDMFIKHLQDICDEKIEHSSSQALLDLLTLTERSAIKVNPKQKSSLENIIRVIQNSHIVDCKHKNLGIAIFMHGGGFTPSMPLPELICTLCGLNITITSNLTPKNCGLRISSTYIDALMTWTKKCFTHREDFQRFSFVEDMLKDPIKAYKEAYFKFPGELEIKIVNYAKMQSASGI